MEGRAGEGDIQVVWVCGDKKVEEAGDSAACGCGRCEVGTEEWIDPGGGGKEGGDWRGHLFETAVRDISLILDACASVLHPVCTADRRAANAEVRTGGDRGRHPLHVPVPSVGLRWGGADTIDVVFERADTIDVNLGTTCRLPVGTRPGDGRHDDWLLCARRFRWVRQTVLEAGEAALRNLACGRHAGGGVRAPRSASLCAAADAQRGVGGRKRCQVLHVPVPRVGLGRAGADAIHIINELRAADIVDLRTTRRLPVGRTPCDARHDDRDLSEAAALHAGSGRQAGGGVLAPRCASLCRSAATHGRHGRRRWRWSDRGWRWSAGAGWRRRRGWGGDRPGDRVAGWQPGKGDWEGVCIAVRRKVRDIQGDRICSARKIDSGYLEEVRLFEDRATDIDGIAQHCT